MDPFPLTSGDARTLLARSLLLAAARTTCTPVVASAGHVPALEALRGNQGQSACRVMKARVLAACCTVFVRSTLAQTVCGPKFSFPPDDLTPTIRGDCGARGDAPGGERPEFVTGTTGNDIIDGSPAPGDRDGCLGVHERLRGRGGDDIFKVDISMVVTGIDDRDGEGDERAWYPDVINFTRGDLMVIYTTDGTDVVDQEYIGEIYNQDLESMRAGRQTGQIYVMIRGRNPTKVARMRFDCGEGYTIWWRPCDSDSGFCTAQFCDRANNRVYFPLICVSRLRGSGYARGPFFPGDIEQDFDLDRPRPNWARNDGFAHEACACNVGPGLAGDCDGGPLCENFPDSLP